MWSDMAVKYNQNSSDIEISDGKTEWYPFVVNGLSNPDYFLNDIMVVSPWIIKSPVNVLLCDPVYLSNKPRNYKIKYTHEIPKNNYIRTDVTISFNDPKGSEVTEFIKFNTPLIQILPITENKVNFRIETMSSKERQKIESYTNYRSKFI
jgi:hypothetical protein